MEGGHDPDLLRIVLTKKMVVATATDADLRGETVHYDQDTSAHQQYTLALPSGIHERLADTVMPECDHTTSETAGATALDDIITPVTSLPSNLPPFPFQVNIRHPTPPELPNKAHTCNNNNNNNDGVSYIGPLCQSDIDLGESTTGSHLSPVAHFSPTNLAHQRRGSSPLSTEFPEMSQMAKTLTFPRKFSASFSPARSPLTSGLRNVRRSDIVFGDIIGKGGFGKVYSGSLFGQPAAIKVVQKRRGSGIHREIVQAERLAFTLRLRHQNIVNILDVNMCDGLRGDALIVMELVSPRTLQSILDDVTHTISQTQRLQFALEISRALGYLHRNDVAHLDVKPRNVLMTWDDVCKLGDFGSLTRTRTDLPHEEIEFTQLLGTLPYRAPELMKGCFPTNKADIFSLGITLWQLATRETPHSGANPHWLIYQVTKVNKRPDHHDVGSDVTEARYRDLYTACWDADPNVRPQAKEVLVTLKSLMETSSTCWTEEWGTDSLRAS